MKSLLTIAIVIGGIAGLASSQEPGQETVCGKLEDPRSLYGKPAVDVFVEVSGDTLSRTGLSEQQLKTEIELLLRKFDIPLVKRGSLPKTADLTLSLSVMGDEASYAGGRKAGLYYYHVECEISQSVRLTRNPSIKVINATTWQPPDTLGTVAKSPKATITNVVQDKTKAFINAYLEANPK